MFNFGELPFCTSYTPMFNGEVFNYILYINQIPSKPLYIDKLVEIILNIQQDPQNIISI